MLIELIQKIAAWMLLWLILIPVVMILATPVILTISLFGKNNRYLTRVANGYCAVFDIWYKYGL